MSSPGKTVHWEKVELGDLVARPRPRRDPWEQVVGIDTYLRGKHQASLVTREGARRGCTCDTTFRVLRRVSCRKVLDVQVELFEDGHVRVDGKPHLAPDPDRARRLLGRDPGRSAPAEEIPAVPHPLCVAVQDDTMLVTGLNGGDDRLQRPAPFVPVPELHEYDLVEGVVVGLEGDHVVLQVRDGMEGRCGVELDVAQSAAVRHLLQAAERTAAPSRDTITAVAADVVEHEPRLAARGRPRRLHDALVWVLALRHGLDVQMRPWLAREIRRRVQTLRERAR